MHVETTVLLLFAIAAAVAIVSQRLRIPYTAALVVAGLALGPLHWLPVPHLTRELLFAIFLPGLLFEAALNVRFHDFWRDRVTIVSLAIPGVIASIGLTAALLAPALGALGMAPGFGWREALVFGAVVAATDPIAVVGLFRSMGAPKRLSLLLEAESLLNDGTAIVFFTLVLGLVQGRATSAASLVMDFVRIVGAGALVGGAIGAAVTWLLRRVEEPMLETGLTTVAAYGSFVAAEQFGVSGVIATVVAGMACGSTAARSAMSPGARVAVETHWEYLAFALNSIVFLLIGFEVSLRELASVWPAVLVAYVAVLLSRALIVRGASAVVSRSPERLPAGWSRVLTWGGLRGALSMVLALSLPSGFPHRDLLVAMTFGVVLLTILLQGLTMAPLLRRLGLTAQIAAAHADRNRDRG